MRLTLVLICGLFLIFPAVGSHAVSLTPPAEPAVTPQIPIPDRIDADRNGIDDTLDTAISEKKQAIAFEQNASKRSALEAELAERVRVELVFSRQITQEQIDDFIALGGDIEYIYQSASYGWNARLPLETVESLPGSMGDSFVMVVVDREFEATMDEATRNGRVRPAWASGFAGYPSGYSGNSTTTIGILDTGIDDSHTDLSGRQEYWADFTTDNEASPRDIQQHGTHVTGIALGTGAALGTGTLLRYTDSGDGSGLPSGSFYLSPIHLANGQYTTFSSTATWVGGGTTSLYGIYSADGVQSWYALSTATSGASPITESNSFTASSSKRYQAALVQNSSLSVGRYAIANTVTYAAVGDGFNTLRGVAPGCRWAGFKVFTNAGSGNMLDVEEALDAAIAQRTAHNIKVINLSLGASGSPGLSPTTRAKVNTAVNNGIVAVVSAGNDGPGTAGANQIDDPGRAAMAITVAASNDYNQLTSYTSSGFSSPGADEDYKPDVMAPGGSVYYSLVLAPDSNDADAEVVGFADQQSNDYYNIMGTSMAAPFVSGASALVIQALEQAGLTWSFSSSTHSRLVKMLLSATCTESNANREAGTGTNPTLGRAAAPKDLYEGYGLMNTDAAIEAATISYAGGVIGDSTAGGRFDRRAWARKLSLTSGIPVNVSLDVPAADLDLYLYSGTPDSKGNPIIRAYSTGAGVGVDEAINYTASVTETAYLVIKRVSGSGSWSLSGSVGDTTPPSIDSVSIAPQPAKYAASDQIHVTVVATDNVGVTSVTANTVSLTHGTGNTWTGDITASSTEGSHVVTVIATDAASNQDTDTSQSYMVLPVVFVAGRSPAPSISTWVCANYLFRFCGRATIIDTNSFALDPGAGMTLTVIAPGYTGIADNDLVMARGVLDVGAGTLTCDPANLTKY